MVHVACGSTYSAAITADGELYTWGRGNYGRLGHGELHVHESAGHSLGYNNVSVCLDTKELIVFLIGFQALVRTRPRLCL